MKQNLIILSLMLASLFSFAIEKSELSLSAKNSVAIMERSIEQARNTACKELTAIMKNEMKNGNLEQAMALDKIIKSIQSENEQEGILTEPEKESKYADDILGSWQFRHTNMRIDFKADKSCTVFSGRPMNWGSTWKIEGKKLILTHKTISAEEIYDLPPKKVSVKDRDFITLQGKTSKGDERILYKREID